MSTRVKERNEEIIREMVKTNSRQVITFHTSYFVLSLFHVLIGELQIKVELPLLFLVFGELGDKLTGFLQSAKDTSMDKIKDHLLPSE